ncbi:hypothetical protein SLEP1_g25439 [Rubroshorea leprosula]|uniref:Uncharacterized protein n=1 Tax=Rubroshorea leprosula TaxID=152421 RepID=A0AAV5JUJ1_9ROSI|nr:hypothetical protein SLEP1_g25439 [Rubroshorea leprosula]
MLVQQILEMIHLDRMGGPGMSLYIIHCCLDLMFNINEFTTNHPRSACAVSIHAYLVKNEECSLAVRYGPICDIQKQNLKSQLRYLIPLTTKYYIP